MVILTKVILTLLDASQQRRDVYVTLKSSKTASLVSVVYVEQHPQLYTLT
jgi:hypothetical protein